MKQWWLVDRSDGLPGILLSDDPGPDAVGPFASYADADDALTGWMNST